MIRESLESFGLSVDMGVVLGIIRKAEAISIDDML